MKYSKLILELKRSQEVDMRTENIGDLTDLRDIDLVKKFKIIDLHKIIIAL